jgi:hypothetical protein
MITSSDDMNFEQPGYWQPEDWSPDGRHLLLLHLEDINMKMMRSDLVELDMNRVAMSRTNAQPWQPWQQAIARYTEPALSEVAPVYAHRGRYSPNGEFIVTTAIRKRETVADWKALDFELGIIARRDGSYRKVVSHENGLRGPVCWSPDGKQILFSRPLEKGDQTEQFASDDPKALNQEWGLGLWIINTDGTSERMLTTGWSPDWK